MRLDVYIFPLKETLHNKYVNVMLLYIFYCGGHDRRRYTAPCDSPEQGIPSTKSSIYQVNSGGGGGGGGGVPRVLISAAVKRPSAQWSVRMNETCSLNGQRPARERTAQGVRGVGGGRDKAATTSTYLKEAVALERAEGEPFDLTKASFTRKNESLCVGKLLQKFLQNAYKY